MSSDTIFIIIVAIVLFCGCIICWIECCSDIICIEDEIATEPDIVNPVIEL
jgi:hypothetical protein